MPYLNLTYRCIAFDMPDGSICCLAATRIHIISSFEQSEIHIDFTEQKYRANEVCISTKSYASKPYVSQLL